MDDLKFVFTLQDSNSFAGMFPSQEPAADTKQKVFEDEATRTSVLANTFQAKHSAKQSFSGIKTTDKHVNSAFKHYQIFRDLDRKNLEKATQSIPKADGKIAKRIKKRITLAEIPNNAVRIVSNTYANQPISQAERLKLYDWLMEVCEVLEFPREAYYKCLNLFEKIKIVRRSKAQLLATTSLFLVSKLEDNSQRIDTFSQITQSYCKINDILQCEKQIMMEAQFKINSKTIHQQLHETLTVWDCFIKTTKIKLNKQFIFLDKDCFESIKHYLNMTVLLDYLRVHQLFQQNPLALIIAAIFIIVGIEMAEFDFDEAQSKPRLNSYIVTSKLINSFICQHYKQECRMDEFYKNMPDIMRKCGILKSVPTLYERIRAKWEQKKYQSYSQLHLKTIFNYN